MPVSAWPEPFSVPLQEALRKSLAAVPSGKRGVMSLGLSRKGVEAAVGWHLRQNLSVSGYAAKDWRGQWDGGTKATFTW